MDDFAQQAAENHTRILMTELFAPSEDMSRWYGGSETSRGSHVPLNLALLSTLNKDSTAEDFLAVIDHSVDSKPIWGTEANWALGSDQFPRIGYRFGEERVEAIAMLSMMLPGVSVIYYVSLKTFNFK